MAMTKLEKTEMQALRDALARSEAQNKQPFETRPLTADSGQGWCFNSYRKEVTFGDFRTYQHRKDIRYSASQGRGGPWFATRLEAMQACRNELAVRLLQELAGMDAEIAKCAASSDAA